MGRRLGSRSVSELLVRLKQWRGRRGDDEARDPKWMGTIDAFSPVKSLEAGSRALGSEPEEPALVVARRSKGDKTRRATLACRVGPRHDLAGQIGIGVATPVVIYFALGSRAGALLEGMKAWLGRNNAVIMAVLCLVIGAKLVGDAIAGFST